MGVVGVAAVKLCQAVATLHRADGGPWTYRGLSEALSQAGLVVSPHQVEQVCAGELEVPPRLAAGLAEVMGLAVEYFDDAVSAQRAADLLHEAAGRLRYPVAVVPPSTPLTNTAHRVQMEQDRVAGGRSVLAVGWAACGSAVAGGADLSGRCAHCGTVTDRGRSVVGVVSPRFTGFDTWVMPGSQVMCPPCVWAFTYPPLRRQAHLVQREPPQLTQVSRPDLAALLAAGPVDPVSAVVVPLRAGRKHVFAAARWATVTVDDAQLVWGGEQAELLTLAIRLRELGFGPRMLEQSAPAFAVLNRLPRPQWAGVMQDWNRLAQWRSPASPWLALVAWLTMTPAGS